MCAVCRKKEQAQENHTSRKTVLCLHPNQAVFPSVCVSTLPHKKCGTGKESVCAKAHCILLKTIRKSHQARTDVSDSDEVAHRPASQNCTHLLRARQTATQISIC